VGYDDDAFGGTGGFKIANSWDTTWGQRGFAYLSYRFIEAFAFDVYTMSDRPDYQPSAIARFDLEHPFWGWSYDNVTVSVGVGGSQAPTWQKTYLAGLERDYLRVDMAVDISEGVSHLPPDATRGWWLRISDSSLEDTALLRAFELSSGSSAWSASPVMPLTGPFYGGTLYAPVPCGATPASQYYVNDGSTSGDVYCSAPGTDSNDGLSPTSPKRSLQDLIDAYTLRAGDIVWIDSGDYALASDIVVTQLDRGSAAQPLRFVGALGVNGEPTTRLIRTGSSGACLSLTQGAENVTFEAMALSGGTSSVSYNGDWSFHEGPVRFMGLRLGGTAGDAVSLHEAQRVWLERCTISGFVGTGIRCTRSSVSVQSSTVHGQSNQSGISVTGSRVGTTPAVGTWTGCRTPF